MLRACVSVAAIYVALLMDDRRCSTNMSARGEFWAGVVRVTTNVLTFDAGFRVRLNV
jgi:hypothetical protein